MVTPTGRTVPALPADALRQKRGGMMFQLVPAVDELGERVAAARHRERHARTRYFADLALLNAYREDGLITAERMNTLTLERFDQYLAEAAA
jgi:hypothetical protein